MASLYSEIVVFIRLDKSGAENRLPAFLAGKALRTYKSREGVPVLVFGGEAFFTLELVTDKTLPSLAQSEDICVTFDLANYLPEGKIAQTIEIPRVVVLAAARLHAALQISTYVTAD